MSYLLREIDPVNSTLIADIKAYWYAYIDAHSLPASLKTDIDNYLDTGIINPSDLSNYTNIESMYATYKAGASIEVFKDNILMIYGWTSMKYMETYPVGPGVGDLIPGGDLRLMYNNWIILPSDDPADYFGIGAFADVITIAPDDYPITLGPPWFAWMYDKCRTGVIDDNYRYSLLINSVGSLFRDESIFLTFSQPTVIDTGVSVKNRLLYDVHCEDVMAEFNFVIDGLYP